MINTLLNVILTPTTVATPPPEMPAIVQTYNWQTQQSDNLGASGDSSPSSFVTYSLYNFPGKAPTLLPDDSN